MLSVGLVFAATQAEGKMLLTDIHALSKPECICNDFGKKDSGKPLATLGFDFTRSTAAIEK